MEKGKRHSKPQTAPGLPRGLERWLSRQRCYALEPEAPSPILKTPIKSQAWCPTFVYNPSTPTEIWEVETDPALGSLQASQYGVHSAASGRQERNPASTG